VRERREVAVVLAASLVIVAALLVVADEPTGRDQRWNLVVIVADDQPFDSVPHEPPVMPYLQAAAADPDEHWVTFSNAVVNTPLCCPSRATLLTGRYAHEHGVTTNREGHLLDERSTIAAWLHAAGYHTGLVGKYLNRYPFGREPFVPLGWDRWWARRHGPAGTLYYDYTLVEQTTPVDHGHEEGDYLTDVLADLAVGFVRDAPPDRPFFLWFAPTAPHAPWTPAPRHDGALASLPLSPPPSVGEPDVTDKPGWVRALPPLDDADHEALLDDRRRSFASLLAVDEAVEAIVEAVRARGDLDRTVIVYVSDNGLSFGEHRWVRKTCPYEECTRVPFLVRHPDATSRTVRSVVSSIDLAPTLAEIAGIEPPEPMAGESLVGLLTGAVGRRDATAYLESPGDRLMPRWWQARTRRYAYVELATGERELYDLRADRYELENVVDDSRYAAVVARLATRLERFRRS
jgi:arylsulfatase A-like enzyme